MHINLLPSAFRRQLLIRRCLTRWRPVWLACFAVSAVYIAASYRTLAKTKTELAVVESQCQPIRLVMAEAGSYDRELKQVQASKSELLALAPKSRALPIVAVVSQAAQSLAGQLQLRRLSFQHAIEAPQTPDPKAVGNADKRRIEKGRLSLEALATSDAAVASFIEALRNTKVIHHVELKSSAEASIGGQAGRKFEVYCHF